MIEEFRIQVANILAQHYKLHVPLIKISGCQFQGCSVSGVVLEYKLSYLRPTAVEGDGEKQTRPKMANKGLDHKKVVKVFEESTEKIR